MVYESYVKLLVPGSTGAGVLSHRIKFGIVADHIPRIL
jgi:hypothetical protein